jgi:hypothetical protein
VLANNISRLKSKLWHDFDFQSKQSHLSIYVTTIHGFIHHAKAQDYITI